MSTSPITPYFEFIGRTSAINDVDIIPRVGGEIVSMHFKDGDMVDKGDLLYQLDPRPFQAELKSAQASLIMAESEVIIARNNKLRAQELIKDNSISQATYDEAFSQYATAVASVSVAEAAVTSAELKLGFCSITAPFSGRTGFSNYKVGDRVTIAIKNRLVSIVQVDPIQFNFEINEKLYRQIRSGVDIAIANNETIAPDIRLKLSDNQLYSEMGQIYAVGNKINPETGSINIQASFANPTYSLLPGEHGILNVEFINQTVDGMLVPLAALQQNQAGDFVMVVDKDMVVTPRYVELGQKYGVQRHVRSGLHNNERIVTKGLQKIRAGISVQTVTPAK
ncbi:efflux RND transporter periplasmic adaptor subunit [Shewanella benthica]|nr:efflux RND transporter periplasmic adaptor subunit [Shewanella benthica]